MLTTCTINWGCGISALARQVVSKRVAFTWKVGEGVVGKFKKCCVLDVDEVLLDARTPQTCIVVKVLYRGRMSPCITTCRGPSGERLEVPTYVVLFGSSKFLERDELGYSRTVGLTRSLGVTLLAGYRPLVGSSE